MTPGQALGELVAAHRSVGEATSSRARAAEQAIAAGVTLRRAAEACGVSTQTIANWAARADGGNT